MEGSGGGKRPWEQFPGRLMLSALLGVRVEVAFSDVYLGDVDGNSSGLTKTMRVACLSQELSLAEH